MSTAPDLREVARILGELLPAGYGAALFGSRATGRARPGSDWDVGILGPVPLDGALRQRVRDALDDLPTLHRFDVVDLAAVPAAFRDEALRTAVRLV
jgi:predicted nucleotidyltransferase